MTDDRSRLTGSGPGLRIAVLSLCSLLAVAVVAMLAMIADRYVDAAMQVRRSVQAVAARRSAIEAVTPPPTTGETTDNRKVAPLGNPGAWFAGDDYPPAARRAGEQGRVSVKLSIGTDGRVSGCLVAQSSGSTSLDEATCRLAQRHGRFRPAMDRGAPIASTYALPGVRWQLEQ